MLIMVRNRFDRSLAKSEASPFWRLREPHSATGHLPWAVGSLQNGRKTKEPPAK
jgi:hypothetical protein